ncbi:hypothetical protein IWT5_01143 [Secundilactobacillus silagincola]|uniref:Uncharacterized protein n=1 Tax=Secundilactobacillus silagincola TaxID=1714681 RepID=A0A1Z5J2G0_9LACO|nr:hypothetical protein IWT5_01143 [Secundilactobacillus silagincola]
MKLTDKNKAKTRSNRTLTDKTSTDASNAKSLTSDKRSSVLFKVAVTEVLQSPYTFAKLKPQDIKGFSQFLKKTVGRNLTISEVEKEYLRTGGPHGAKNEEIINGIKQNVYHFSNGERDFRIHGYYNTDAYFCLCRIDPHHKFDYK